MISPHRRRLDALTALWNAGDDEGFRAGLHPEIEFLPDPRWPEPGPYRGREAVTRFLEEYRSAWEEVQLQVDSVEERLDALVAGCRWLVQGRSSGADVPVAFTLVMRFGPDDLVVRMAAFFDRDDGLAWVEATAP